MIVLDQKHVICYRLLYGAVCSRFVQNLNPDVGRERKFWLQIAIPFLAEGWLSGPKQRFAKP